MKTLQDELSEWAKKLLEREKPDERHDNHREEMKHDHRGRHRERTCHIGDRGRNYDERYYEDSRDYQRGSRHARDRPSTTQHSYHQCHNDRRNDSVERHSRSTSNGREMLTDLLNNVYLGRVDRIMDFGAFVSFRSKKARYTGLVHVSEILPGKRRLNNVKDVLSEDMKVYVKVIALNGEKISLSMKTIDQQSGMESSSVTSTTIPEPTSMFDGAPERRGELSGVILDEYAYGVDGKKRRMLTDMERWEQQQLLSSGVLSKSDRINMHLMKDHNVVEEEEIEIEVNEAFPTFLKGQTRRSGML